ncbi:hypothetical protein C8J56DRAFT_727807, partial [Mycena floridula]
GFYPLTNPSRTSQTKPNTNSVVTHHHYASVIQLTATRSVIPAKIRIYAKATDPMLAPNTVAVVIVKFHFPGDGTAELDALDIIPALGDPTDATYQDGLPNWDHPTF